ncbi:MAG: hypothetical protein ABI361_12815 [Nitrososphaera sp.]|jgi:hypothetical protein
MSALTSDKQKGRAFPKGSRPTINQVRSNGNFILMPLEPGKCYWVHSGKDRAIKFKNSDFPSECYLFTIGRHLTYEQAERLKADYIASHPNAIQDAAKRKQSVVQAKAYTRSSVEPNSLNETKNADANNKIGFGVADPRSKSQFSYPLFYDLAAPSTSKIVLQMQEMISFHLLLPLLAEVQSSAGMPLDLIRLARANLIDKFNNEVIRKTANT